MSFPRLIHVQKIYPKCSWPETPGGCLQEASLRASKAFAAMTTKADWEKLRDVRIKALAESLGQFPPVPTGRAAQGHERTGRGWLPDP